MSAHPWDGHRVYDGCPDSTMQRRLDHEAARLALLREREPEAHLTYHPDHREQFWVAHVWGRPLSGQHSTRIAAIEEALAKCQSPS